MNRMNLVTEEYSYAMREEINTLRTNIQFAGSDKKVFLVTSCVQGEGKSGVSMKLGRALAELKKKVLVIDADLRKSVVLEKIEGKKPEKGLSHFLSGQAGLSRSTLCDKHSWISYDRCRTDSAKPDRTTI